MDIRKRPTAYYFFRKYGFFYEIPETTCFKRRAEGLNLPVLLHYCFILPKGTIFAWRLRAKRFTHNILAHRTG